MDTSLTSLIISNFFFPSRVLLNFIESHHQQGTICLPPPRTPAILIWAVSFSFVRSLVTCVESSRWDWTLLPAFNAGGLDFFIYEEACYFFVLYYVVCIQFLFPFNWTLAEQPLSFYKMSSEHQLCACEILLVGLTSHVALSPNSKCTFIIGLKLVWPYSVILLRHLGVHFIQYFKIF